MGEMAHGSTSGDNNRVSNLQGIGQQFQQDFGNIEEELQIDKSTMETLKALYAAKERAVNIEDFDEAKRIKDTIDRLKTVAGHISQLEERKRMAIQSEDYEAAKVIKSEIEKLKGSVMYPGF